MAAALRSSCEGYLTLRTSPSAPPPMIRRYCMLVGTRLYYYSTQEDADNMVDLKGEVDVLGVQEWDGKGNVHIYAYAFLFATAQNKVFYAYADTATDKEKWMRGIQLSVETIVPHRDNETSLSNDRLLDPMSPMSSVGSSTAFEAEPSDICPLCEEATPGSGRSKCYSCEHSFCEKHTSDEIPLPHCRYYYAVRVCDECHLSQRFINFLKSIVERLHAGICIYPNPLNPEVPIELLTPSRPSHTEAAEIALGLFKMGLVTTIELEVILKADKRYSDHTTELPEIPLDIDILGLHREFDSENFSMGKAIILLHRHFGKSSMLFKPIVEKILQLSFTSLNDVEFYWPQIVHAYLRVPMYDFDKIFWMEELILSVCSRSIHLALLLVWQLQGALEDSCQPHVPKETKNNYSRIVYLLCRLEVSVVGRDRRSFFKTDEKVRGPPKPTEDQLQQIEDLFALLLDYKNKANTPEAEEKELEKPVLNRRRTDGSTTTSVDETQPLSKNEDTGNKSSNESYETTRFSDFSSFQQHLLTPKDSHSVFSEDDPKILKLNLKETTEETKLSLDIPRDEVEISRQRSISAAEKNVLSHYFSEEREFVRDITDLAERLRFVPTSDRKTEFFKQLVDLTVPEMVYIPLVKATDAFERVIRIPPDEGTAFSTKARVPILLVFEVLRGGNNVLSTASSPTKGKSFIDMDDEVGQMIDRHGPEGFSHLISSSLTLEEDSVLMEGLEDTFQFNLSLEENTSTAETPRAPICPETPMNEQIGSDSETEMPTEEKANSRRIPHIDLSQIELTEEAIERENNHRRDLEAAFGESWSSKFERLKTSSPFGHLPGWDIVSMIGKSNDDMRQEVFALQMIQKFIDIFHASNLPLWLKCYRIISTSSSTGLIETLVNAISLDGLKKRDGYVSLAAHFEKSYGPINSQRYRQAQSNFIRSMAGYSLVCYFLQIKDRHNGNIMLDNAGHLIHIDFGFLLGIAPGGSFSLETAPFKLTTEMVETMGGVDSDSFKEYVALCTRGFLALQQHCDEICDLVEIVAQESPYPCFVGKDISYIIYRLKNRFKLDYSKKETVSHVLNLIRKSNGNYNTRQYDNFQRMTNGILP